MNRRSCLPRQAQVTFTRTMPTHPSFVADASLPMPDDVLAELRQAQWHSTAGRWEEARAALVALRGHMARPESAEPHRHRRSPEAE